jgi:hypothetical protein
MFRRFSPLGEMPLAYRTDHELPATIRSQNVTDAAHGLSLPSGIALPTAEELMEKALRRTGRHHFSDPSFIMPLKMLLKSLADEADLSTFGRYATRVDFERRIVNLLRMDEAEERDPSIRARPIQRPVFITGMPRSANTFMHELLAQDPANAVPRCWQLIEPFPPQRRLLPFDTRKARIAFELRIFRLLSPGVEELHTIAADAPQECTEITAQVFQSLRFESMYRVPSYQSWIDRHGHYDAFRFHKRFLQHLDAQEPGRRWMLKCPDNVLALDAIRAVYPDALIVFLHRDPLRVVASCTKLAESLRRPFAKHLDPAEVGRQVSGRLIESADHAIAAADRFPDILHFHYRDVIRDPVAAIRTLYGRCSLELDATAQARMTKFASRPSRPMRQYSFAEFGLDADVLRERFAPYVERFAVAEEGSTKSVA